MKTRNCKQCGDPITDSVHARYCLKCRELRKKVRYEANREAYNANRRKRYAEKKQSSQPAAETPKPKVLSGMAPASRRFAKMSLREISAECARLHISYGQASMMAQNGTLPEDWGINT